MRKLLKTLLIIQENKIFDDVLNPKRSRTLYRLNPFNPLTYIAIIIIFVIGILMFGFVGIKNEMDFTNPFKWR